MGRSDVQELNPRLKPINRKGLLIRSGVYKLNRTQFSSFGSWTSQHRDADCGRPSFCTSGSKLKDPSREFSFAQPRDVESLAVRDASLGHK